MNSKPPTACPSWSALAAHAEASRDAHLRELFANDPQRASHLVVEAAGVRFDYSRQRLGAMTPRLLARLADERGFGEWREALLSGKPINNTENRAAWHTALGLGAGRAAGLRSDLVIAGAAGGGARHRAVRGADRARRAQARPRH